VPKDAVTSAIEASEVRMHQEEEMRRAIRKGGTTSQLLGVTGIGGDTKKG